jgi:peroxiredoxin
MGARLHSGDVVEAIRLESIRGDVVPIPGPELVHLQFRRYAGCAICNLALRSFAVRHGELRRAGVREVVVFHSSAESMRPYQGDLPFDAIADPEKELYRRFGVETSWRSILDPRAWPAALHGTCRVKSSVLAGTGQGRLGLPADFLIDPKGRIVARKYGAHADDHWTVDEVLSLAVARPAAEPFPRTA